MSRRTSAVGDIHVTLIRDRIVCLRLQDVRVCGFRSRLLLDAQHYRDVASLVNPNIHARVKFAGVTARRKV